VQLSGRPNGDNRVFLFDPLFNGFGAIVLVYLLRGEGCDVGAIVQLSLKTTSFLSNKSLLQHTAIWYQSLDNNATSITTDRGGCLLVTERDCLENLYPADMYYYTGDNYKLIIIYLDNSPFPSAFMKAVFAAPV